MSRHLLTLWNEADREQARRYINQAPAGTRVELKAAKRSLPQNDRMWAMLTDISVQKEHAGRRYTPDVWKTLFMHGWQKEVTLIPSLDGKGIVPLTRSSDLSKQEMSELIEFMAAWGAENGVIFHDNLMSAA